jgi:hypothetical protein
VVLRLESSALLHDYEYDIVTVEQEGIAMFAAGLTSNVSEFGDFIEHHVEKIIEAAQLPSEFTVALHDDPYFAADTLVKNLQWQLRCSACRHADGIIRERI